MEPEHTLVLDGTDMVLTVELPMVESAAGLSCDLEGSQLFNLCLDEHPM